MAKKKKSSWRGKVNKNAKKQKSEKSSFGYLILPKDMKVYKPTPGSREKFDIIPYTVSDKKHFDKDEESDIGMVGTLWYRRPFKVHRSVGADNESVVCLSTFGKKCPICEYRKQQAKEGVDKDDLKELNTSNRNLYAIIPKGVKKFDEEIHVFDYSQFLFQDLLNDELEEDDDNEIFPDLEEGFTLKVRWTKEKFAGNTFAEAGRIDFLKRKAYKESILDEVPNLDKMLKELTYDELHAKFFELDEEDSADEDTSKKRKKKSTKKKKKKELDLTWDDLEDMSLPELLEVCDSADMEPELILVEGEGDELNMISLRTGIAKKLKIKIPKETNKKKPASKKSDGKMKRKKK